MPLIDSGPIEEFIQNGLNSGKFGHDAIEILTEVHYAPEAVVRCKELKTTYEGIPADRLRALAEADRDGLCVVLPCKVGDTIDRLFSHNEIIALWEEHKLEEASPKYLLWRGMAHALPAEYKSRIFVRVFGTIPESIMDADTVNILVTPIITPCAEAEAALREKGEGEK